MKKEFKVFRFVILMLIFPIWAYEKEGPQQTKLPSSPIQVYESQDEEEAGELVQVQAQERERIPVQQEQQTSPTTIIIREQPPVQVYSQPSTPQDKLSRARKQAEEHTENKIRTRLELLRLKDEKARMDQLLSPLDDQHISVQQGNPAPVQQPAVETFKQARKFFIHVGMGYLNHYNSNSPYPQSIERLGSSFTAGFGLYEFDRFSLEYTFSYSKHRVAYPPINNIHYNPTETVFRLRGHSLALKYYLSSQRIKPFIGAIISLNRRSYSTAIGELYRRDPIFYLEGRVVTAVQGGVITGLELFITQRIVLGLDARFYMNIHDLEDALGKNNYYYTVFQIQQPLPEEMSWYNLQGFIRILF